MASESALTVRVRVAIRRTEQDTGITQEINDCIAACKAELAEVGVVNLSEDDALIIRACVLYARAEFNFGGDGDRYRASFEQLKSALSMAGDYNTEQPVESE